MAVRQRICAGCAGQFSYETGRGRDRLYCTPACHNRTKLRLRNEGVRALLCAVGGCEKPPRHPGSAHCDMHYRRLREHGSVHYAGKPAKEKIAHSEGYVLVYVPGHPMTTEGHSHAYEHRVVFFDTRGPGPFNCHVCGAQGMLAEMHVDHLNEVRNDNRLENLKPACPDCNQWRTVTRLEAARRQTHIRWIEHNGERLPASTWAKRIGIKSTSLLLRIENGWPLERALTAPRGRTGPKPGALQQSQSL